MKLLLADVTEKYEGNSLTPLKSANITLICSAISCFGHYFKIFAGHQLISLHFMAMDQKLSSNLTAFMKYLRDSLQIEVKSNEELIKKLSFLLYYYVEVIELLNKRIKNRESISNQKKLRVELRKLKEYIDCEADEGDNGRSGKILIQVRRV